MHAQRSHRVRFVQFGLLTGEQWKAYGVCAVTKPNAHGVGDLANTVYDERMGVLEPDRQCQTCFHTNTECNGHLGYIELAVPVFNPKTLPIVQKVLKCVCVECGALRVSLDHAELKGVRRGPGAAGAPRRARQLKLLLKLCEKVRRCPACGCTLPFLDKDGVRCYYDKKNRQQGITKTPADVLRLFDKIDPAVFTMMGFNHGLSPNPAFSDVARDADGAPVRTHRHANDPRALVFTVLPVIPPCARTWVVRGGDKSDDDLTEKYNNIVRTNAKLRGEGGGGDALSALAREELARKLEEHIFTLIDNQKSANAGGAGASRAHQGLGERVQGKGGRVQDNVVAKRVDFSARTVVDSGGPSIRMGQLGVPAQMAASLTVPVEVTPATLVYARKLAAVGRIKSLWRWNPKLQRKTYRRMLNPTVMAAVGVRLGDTVERTLETGDHVLLNRQPTLRKESMIGHEIVVLPPGESVFRVPLAVTIPLGADFDGRF